jgi:hypothetical protein
MVVAFPRAGSAQNFSFATNFSAEVNSFPTCLAHYALTFVARKFFWGEFDLHPLHREQFVAGDFAVG